METTLKVSGMHCRACNMLIEDAVSEISGAQVLSADYTTGAVTVTYDSDETLEKIRAAIRNEGFSV
jgi:copper chaperone